MMYTKYLSKIRCRFLIAPACYGILSLTVACNSLTKYGIGDGSSPQKSTITQGESHPVSCPVASKKVNKKIYDSLRQLGQHVNGVYIDYILKKVINVINDPEKSSKHEAYLEAFRQQDGDGLPFFHFLVDRIIKCSDTTNTIDKICQFYNSNEQTKELFKALDKNGQTILHYLVRRYTYTRARNSNQRISLIIPTVFKHAHEYVDLKNNVNLTAGELAYAQGKIDCILLLTQKGINVGCSLNEGLMQLVRYGYSNEIKKLFNDKKFIDILPTNEENLKAIINTQDKDGNGYLHLAVKALIEYNRDIPTFKNIVRTFIDKGIDTTMTNNNGQTALQLVQESNNFPNCLKYLSDVIGKNTDQSAQKSLDNYNLPMEGRAIIPKGTNTRVRAAHQGVMQRKKINKDHNINNDNELYLMEDDTADSFQEKLKKKGLSINDTIDNDGNTILHQVTKSSFLQGVKTLLSIPGINVNPKNKYGITPLHEAVTQKNLPMEELLSQNGAFYKKNE